MKKWLSLLLVGGVLMTALGLVLAQSDDAPMAQTPVPQRFELVSEIGRALPRHILYNAPMDQYMVVDAYNRLALVDAQTFSTQHILYEAAQYRDFVFSHDGTLLAIALERRIELWDTATGQLIARLTELGQPQAIVAPITFSRDDSLLIFEGVYPAPRSIRTYEGQTVTVPWVWHIPSARGTNTSNFPGRAEAWQFFDYRNGLVIAPDNRLVAALPGRIQVLDSDTLTVLFEIPTNRYENDPMRVQFSARDDQIYFQPNDETVFVQVDTERGVLTEIPIGRGLTRSDLELLGGIQLSQQARRLNSSLARRFLPNNPADIYEAGRLSVTLVDLIVPPISEGDNIRALIFIYNERTELGYFRLTSGGSSQMILSPDENQLVLRAYDEGNERITTYNLDSGQRLRSFVPSLRGIGNYSRLGKNRVLAFNATGEVLVSDFQRYDAATNAVITQDLSYSRRFDDFFIAPDNQSIVTMSGSEWRVWDTTTREVVRREVLNLRGSKLAVAPDGYRWLTYATVRGVTSVQISDLHHDTITQQTRDFQQIPGSEVSAIFPNRTWTTFLVVYSVNSYGEYAPGNQIAFYSMEEGLLWHMAGDDLPPPRERNYGWVDEETAFITGFGYASEQPARIYGVDYHDSDVPQCIVDAFPEQLEAWRLLWQNRLYYLRNDQLHQLATLVCRERPQTVAAAEELLLPTPTVYVTVTPILIPDVPTCLTIAYADEGVADYVAIWQAMIADLNAEQRAEMERVVCEGLGDPELPLYDPQAANMDYQETMFIDMASGERSTGAFTPAVRRRRAVNAVIDAFQAQYERAPGQLVLSPDGNLIATSNLPGELRVYRIIDGYDAIMVNVTATAGAIQSARNWVYPQPSATPPYELVGTARPTLTPTPQPTPIPDPPDLEQARSDDLESLCPTHDLYTPDNLPDGWSPPGSIATQIQDDVLWRVNPITGARYPDASLPQCYEGVDCNFSPDHRWILANTSEASYLVRPDGSDERGLWRADDLDDDVQDYPFRRRPNHLRWWNSNTLQWTSSGYDEQGEYHEYLNRDILGVFPDPDPIVIEPIVINDIVAQEVYAIRGSEWVVASIPFNTGLGSIDHYYLYHKPSRDWLMFAREYTMSFGQDLTGTRLFYSYTRGNRYVINQIDLSTISAEHYEARHLPSYTNNGIWSNDGRYRIGRSLSTINHLYPIMLWDMQTGLRRQYCLPETGTRDYDGTFLWSPDNRYVALRAPLPKDEADDGVGEHLLILDIETGAFVDVTTGVGASMFWVAEAYD